MAVSAWYNLLFYVFFPQDLQPSIKKVMNFYEKPTLHYCKIRLEKIQEKCPCTSRIKKEQLQTLQKLLSSFFVSKMLFCIPIIANSSIHLIFKKSIFVRKYTQMIQGKKKELRIEAGLLRGRATIPPSQSAPPL